MTRSPTGLACAVLLVAMSGATWGAGAQGDKPASPRSLPSDGLPPFGMLDDNGRLVPLPTSLPARPAADSGPPAPVAPGPSLDVAMEGARAALDACTAQGHRIAVAVVDAEGSPRALLMAEGSAGSVFVAMRKAIATLAYRVPSSQISALLAADPALLAQFTPVMFLSGGALPIVHRERLIGAIASSGAHGAGPIGTQDEACARAGLELINRRLGTEGK